MSVVTSKLDGLKLPLLLQPSAEGDLQTLTGWIRDNQELIEQHMRQVGAVLFRGFDVRGPDDFQQVVKAFPVETLTYLGGNTPRTKVTDGIYTSTEIVARYKIKLHNELSFQVNYPHKIFFYCQRAAATGGETILADVRDVYHSIDPKVVETFEERGVKYVRVFQERRAYRELAKKLIKSYFHLTWPQLFATEDKATVEAHCRRLQINHAWRPNGDLELTNTLPAVIKHPDTGESLWFNHVPSLHFNVRTLGPAVYRTRKLLYRREEDLPTQVYYGDGGRISEADLATVYDALDTHTIGFPWREGDVLVIDNRVVAHGRNPFTGDRRVLVALTRPVEARA